MRTTKGENEKMGRWIGNKLNQFKSKSRFLIPLNGFSALDKKGQAFYDPDADQAFVRALEETVSNSNISIIKIPNHINDKKFSTALVEHYNELNKEL